MNISIDTTVIYTVQLSDADVGEILSDASAFQGRLRAVRNAKAATGPNARKSIKIARHTRGEHSDPKASMRPSASGKIACATCGKLLKPKGMALHMRKAHPDSVVAETA